MRLSKHSRTRRWPRRALCFELIEPFALLGRENFPHSRSICSFTRRTLQNTLRQNRIELATVMFEDGIRFSALLGAQAELAQGQMSEVGRGWRTVLQIALRPEHEPDTAGNTRANVPIKSSAVSSRMLRGARPTVTLEWRESVASLDIPASGDSVGSFNST
jgi:hypothetical protein